MANRQIGNNSGVVLVGGHPQNGGASEGDNLVIGNAAGDVRNIANMRTRLAAINGAVYTTARLDQMSANDMLYAIRLADDRASFGILGG